jgi:hypothetical protein
VTKLFINPVGGALYEAHLNAPDGETMFFEPTTQPLLDAARVLSGCGWPDDTELQMWRDGTPYAAMTGKIGYLKTRSIHEDSSGTPRFSKVA